MNVLIDTHALIWFITNDSKLPDKSKALISDFRNTLYVSIASLWEITIKYSIGRLDLHTDLETLFTIIDESGFKILPITQNHLLVNSQLAFHHQDPFDRIIIAQALAEQLTILSKDTIFQNYTTNIYWS